MEQLYARFESNGRLVWQFDKLLQDDPSLVLGEVGVRGLSGSGLEIFLIKLAVVLHFFELYVLSTIIF